ncbi:MAG: helix-hairpin-helix domain-containing protein, partial [Bacteroidales bacterium]|nr:helix-hairpin-helix domain-containing protein [Bacteroidales bacterium]
KEYFSFNKRERQGIFVLLSLILTLLLINVLLPKFTYNTEFDSSEFEKEMLFFEKSRDRYFDSLNNIRQMKLISESNDQQIKLFKFDPNHLSAEEWKKLGLSEKQIKVINNYKEKGGKFYKKEDLKKIYSISESKYKLLEPFITIPTKKKQQRKKQQKETIKKTQVKKKIIIELNSADSAGLTKLYGIGPAFSSRIIKYRNLLGGFYSKDQLLEIYGFDSTRLKMIIKNISVETEKIKKININNAGFKELLRHPYISYELTSQIFKLKNKQGQLKNIKQLKKIDLVNDSLFQKLVPYLSVK